MSYFNKTYVNFPFDPSLFQNLFPGTYSVWFHASTHPVSERQMKRLVLAGDQVCHYILKLRSPQNLSLAISLCTRGIKRWLKYVLVRAGILVWGQSVKSVSNWPNICAFCDCLIVVPLVWSYGCLVDCCLVWLFYCLIVYSLYEWEIKSGPAYLPDVPQKRLPFLNQYTSGP